MSKGESRCLSKEAVLITALRWSAERLQAMNKMQEGSNSPVHSPPSPEPTSSSMQYSQNVVRYLNFYNIEESPEFDYSGPLTAEKIDIPKWLSETNQKLEPDMEHVPCQALVE
jgi:hypothetical protein